MSQQQQQQQQQQHPPPPPPPKQHQQQRVEVVVPSTRKVRVTLQNVHKALLSKPELSDLTLQANDGKTQIKVQRCMMAARSPVFHCMLYGKFVEASESVIKLDYSGDVLQAIVQYIYTDETTSEFLNEDIIIKSKKERTKKEEVEELVKKIASLIDASTCYGLTGLYEEVTAFAIEMIEKYPDSSVLFLAVCDNCAALIGSNLEKLAFEQITKKPQMLLEEGGESIVGMLSSTRIERIIFVRRQAEIDELILFKILKVWTDAEKKEETSSCDRKRKANELTEYMSLECIDPADLSTTVEPSGLVSTDRLCQAYKKQALASTSELQHHGLSYKKLFSPTFRVFYKNIVFSRTKSLVVNPAYTIDFVKTMIHRLECIPPAKQRLYLNLTGNELKDGLTLADYNIQKDTTLHLFHSSYFK